MNGLTDIDKLSEVTQRLKQVWDKIDAFDIPRTNFSAILENEKLLAVYHNDWIAIARQIGFVRHLREQFLRDYQSNPELAIGNIKARLNELIGLMQVFDQKEISRLRHAILMLSKLEMEELKRCIEDVMIWPDYRLKKRGIEFFIQRLELYLKGGKDEATGENYLGLASNFKDVELARRMFAVPEIKRLWTYQKMLTFFNYARYVTREALKRAKGFYRNGNRVYRVNHDGTVDYSTADYKSRWYPAGFMENYVTPKNGFEGTEGPKDYKEWHLFLGTKERNYKDGFYNNLIEGDNYINIIRERFGNSDVADFFEKTADEVGQSPKNWDRKLAEFERTLHDFTYENKELINPAAQALLAVFRDAADRIASSKLELKEIEAILETLEDSIKRRVKKLRDEAAILLRDFNKADKKVVKEMGAVVPILIDLMIKVGTAPQRRLGRIRQTLDKHALSLGEFKSGAQSAFAKPVVPIGGAAFFAGGKADEHNIAASLQISAPLIGQTFVQSFESYISQVEKRIDTILIPELQRIVDFVREHDTKFKMPISETRELLPEVNNLILKLQNELAKEFKAWGIDLTKPMYG